LECKKEQIEPVSLLEQTRHDFSSHQTSQNLLIMTQLQNNAWQAKMHHTKQYPWTTKMIQDEEIIYKKLEILKEPVVKIQIFHMRKRFWSNQVFFSFPLYPLMINFSILENSRTMN